MSAAPTAPVATGVPGAMWLLVAAGCGVIAFVDSGGSARMAVPLWGVCTAAASSLWTAESGAVPWAQQHERGRRGQGGGA